MFADYDDITVSAAEYEALKMRVESLEQELKTLDSIGDKINKASEKAFDEGEHIDSIFVYVTDFGSHKIIPVSNESAKKIRAALRR